MLPDKVGPKKQSTRNLNEESSNSDNEDNIKIDKWA